MTEVEKASPAEDAEVRSGMLITAVDGQTPAELTALAKLIAAKMKAKHLHLDLAVRQRAGNFRVLRQASVDLIPR